MNWILTGSVAMFIGVALGAFGAHGLKSRVTPEALQIFETGVRYHLTHALALFIVAWVAEKFSSGYAQGAGWYFLVGIFLFSGSLYGYALTSFRPLAFITPVGGLCFLLGWIWLALASLRRS